MTSKAPNHVQVLVAGAGPVGLTVAHELARRGLSVRLIDAAAQAATTSRAIATHPRTLETYDQMGVADDIVRRGQRIRAFTMFGGGNRLVRLAADYSTMPTHYPFTLAIEQIETEAALRSAVAEHGVKVEWGTRLHTFEDSPDSVNIELRTNNDTVEHCTASWLIGCDGGHSTVRKQLGLQLRGNSSETWMLADAEVHCELPRDSIYWVHTGGQALMMVPFQQNNRWRLLDTTPETQQCEQDPSLTARRFAGKLSMGTGKAITVADPDWISVFTFQQRMIDRMRIGRIMLAGDAAHVHSPASGQGMNTGIQEGYNLAWKLAMVEQGQALPDLLESYTAERVPIGARLLGSTSKATFLVQLKNAAAGVALPIVFGIVRTIKPLQRLLQRKILGGISGLLLGYQDSALTTKGGRSAGPQPGTRASRAAAEFPDSPGCAELRAELRDPRWSLIVRGPEPELTERGWLNVRRIDHDLSDPTGELCTALGLDANGWVLIRPDGYIAARGISLDERILGEALAPFSPIG